MKSLRDEDAIVGVSWRQEKDFDGIGMGQEGDVMVGGRR